MVMKILKLILIISALFFAVSSRAQTEPPDSTTQTYVVTKLDDTEYIGIILSDDGREVLIETKALGKIYIPKSEIRSITKVEDKNRIVHGEFRETGPFTTRYAFTNNAHPVTKGESYALLNLYGPEVHFAISNNFSLGIMATWLASPMVLALKYSIPTSDSTINFSVGTLMGTSGYLNTFRGYGGLHWANVTLGNRMNNVTLGAGYGYFDAGFNNLMETPGTYYNMEPAESLPYPVIDGPMASLGLIVKVGAKASFVFDAIFMYIDEEFSEVETTYYDGYYDEENDVWVDPTYRHDVELVRETGFAMIIMPGLRFQKTPKKAFQFNLAGVAYTGGDNPTSFPFPMCTWFYRF
jgi:hypothetical protein